MKKIEEPKDVRTALLAKSDEFVETANRLKAAAADLKPTATVLQQSQLLVEMEKVRGQAEKLVGKF